MTWTDPAIGALVGVVLAVLAAWVTMEFRLVEEFGYWAYLITYGLAVVLIVLFFWTVGVL